MSNIATALRTLVGSARVRICHVKIDSPTVARGCNGDPVRSRVGRLTAETQEASHDIAEPRSLTNSRGRRGRILLRGAGVSASAAKLQQRGGDLDRLVRAIPFQIRSIDRPRLPCPTSYELARRSARDSLVTAPPARARAPAAVRDRPHQRGPGGHIIRSRTRIEYLPRRQELIVNQAREVGSDTVGFGPRDARVPAQGSPT